MFTPIIPYLVAGINKIIFILSTNGEILLQVVMTESEEVEPEEPELTQKEKDIQAEEMVKEVLKAIKKAQIDAKREAVETQKKASSVTVRYADEYHKVYVSIFLYWITTRLFNFISYFSYYLGAQWLSGRVLDLRPRGRGFEPHRRHCIVVLEQDTFILA